MVGVACSGGSGATHRPAPGPTGEILPGELAGDDAYRPSYGKAELSRALIAERGMEASAERQVTDFERAAADDRLFVARADLAVRRRFIASLEACETAGRDCPPRLDDPPWSYDLDADPMVDPKLETPLRFDLESWRKVAAELHGRACACRTQGCVDSVGVAIDQLEVRPILDVQGDEAASDSLARARTCLFRLRGKRAASGGTRVTGGSL